MDRQKKCRRCSTDQVPKWKSYCEKCRSQRDKERTLRFRHHNADEVKKYHSEYNRQYYLKNLAVIKGKNDANPKKEKLPHKWTANYRNEYARKYYKAYFKNKPSQRIAVIFRQRLWRLLNGIPVALKMEEIIGCSKPFLKEYIEKLFQEGMTWHNHTKDGWHIDHIKPCCKFNLTDMEDLKKCFHYTNLQPLWAKDNMRKGGR